jgi:6-phosphogluconolactonase (cycloisomerase 2 family)
MIADIQGDLMRAIVFLSVLLAGCASNTGPSPNSTLLYVANLSSNAVTAYAADASGDVAPRVTIAGANTGLDQPAGIVRDATGRLYVATFYPPTVRVFAAGANGNVAPIRVIGGTNTHLGQAIGLALDATDRLYVSNGGDTITIYAAGARGNVAPIAMIAGTNTMLNGPRGIAFDGTGRLYVANAMTNRITVYGQDASGNVAPVDTIVGPSTQLNGPAGLAFDAGGQLYVSNVNGTSPNQRITVYSRGASGDATPIAIIMGANTELDTPFGIVVDPSGRLYVASAAFGSQQYKVTVYAAAANGNVAPTATIAGPTTGLSAPGFLSF